MLNRIALSLPLLALAIGTGTGFAQNPEPQKFYRLEFVVKEVEGTRVLNARSYSMTISSAEKDNSSIRAGSRVPIQTSANSTQYFDVGVNIDCRGGAKEIQGDLSLFVIADVSSVPQAESAAPSGSAPAQPPTVRQNKWSSSVLVPLKKPTLIFASDDVASKRQMQLQLTATPIR